MSKPLGWSKPENLRFRDRRLAKIIEVFVPTTDEILSTETFPICVWIKGEGDRLDLHSYTLNGHFFHPDINHSFDIIEIEEEHGQIT